MKSIKLILFVLAAVMLSGAFTSCSKPVDDSSAKPSKPAVQKSEYNPKESFNGMDVVAENPEMMLLYHPEDAVIGIYNKESGFMWRSSPEKSEFDEVADQDTINGIMSQFSFDFYGNGTRVTTFTSYADSVAKNQFTPYAIENGIRLEYTVGESESVDLFPEALTAKTMDEEILPKLDSSQKDRILQFFTKYSKDTPDILKDDLSKKYTNFPDIDIYVVPPVIPEKFKNQMVSAFKEAGFNAETLKSEYEKMGYSTALQIRPSFFIPVEYVLEGNRLSIKVAYSEIGYNSDVYKLTKLNVLPHFGACPKSDDGYLFVPDGSGVLVNLNNNSKDAISARIYGPEINADTDDTLIRQPAYLPVYGMKRQTDAFLAVIEEGDALGSITAAPFNNVSGLNRISATFSTWPREVFDPEGLVRGAEFARYGKQQYQGDIKLCLFFLCGSNADYSGMARVYRSHLFGEQSKTNNTALYVDTYGVINRKETVLGFNIKKDRAYTTISGLTEMLKTLKATAQEEVSVRYVNWNGDTLNDTVKTGGTPAALLGSAGDLDKLLSFAKDSGVEIRPDYQMMYAAKNSLTDNFKANADSAFSIENSPAKLLKDDKKLSLLNARAIGKMADNLLSRSKTFTDISLSNIGADLFTDYSKPNFAIREDNKNSFTTTVQKLSERYSLQISGANAYLLPYVAAATDLPFGGSGYRIQNQSVPFLQLVLSGQVGYTGVPLNMSYDAEMNFLKAVEYGARLKFVLNQKSSELLKGSGYTDLCTTEFDKNLEKVRQYHERDEARLPTVKGAAIYSHTMLNDSVSETAYDNGTRIFVNYGETEYVSGEVTVRPMDYAVIEAGGNEQ